MNVEIKLKNNHGFSWYAKNRVYAKACLFDEIRILERKQ